MDITTFIYILVVVAICLYLYSQWLHSYWKRKGLNYIEPEFPYGITRPLMKRELSFGDLFKKIYQEMKSKGWRHGGYYLFFRASYMPIDLELVKCILQKDFYSFVNHGMYVNEKNDPLTGHLFNLENEKWRSMRTKLTPTFTSGKMKMMFQTLLDCSSGLEGVLTGYETTNEPIDIKDVLARYTTDVIGSCAFGIDCNSLKNPDSEFRQFGRKIFETSFTRRFRSWVFTLTPSFILKAIRIKQSSKDIEDFFIGIVRNTVKYRETNNIHRKDFMHLLLQLKNHGRVTEDSEINGDVDKTNSNNLSVNEMAAQCFVFFVAGFETSATTMTFALYELAANQEIQEKLREEIRSVLKKHDNKISYEAIMEMTYLDMVVHETLRKHPPIAGTPRVCNKPYKIPGTDIVLAPGIRVHIPIHGIQRDPEYYPEPEKFDPERFTEENKSRRHPFAFIPFGEGPRICIGSRFGLLQSKVGLMAIIRKFQVTLSEKTKTPLKYAPKDFISTADGGVWLKVKKIEQNE